MKDTFEALATVTMLVIAAWTLHLLLKQKGESHGGCGCGDKKKPMQVAPLPKDVAATPPTACGMGTGKKAMQLA